jgi:hypothetical protein
VNDEPTYEDPQYEKKVKALLDDPVVAKWKCRTGTSCGAMVDAPRSAVESLGVFNAQLAARRQPLIQTGDVLFCPTCKQALKAQADEARRAKGERLAPIVKMLTQSPHPEREHALIRQLREWKHPDVDGLVNALKARRGSVTGGGSI